MHEIEELYKAYKQDVFSYLISLTHDAALSEDLLSETFLQAIKSLSTFKGQSTVKTWLFGIARNIWFNYLRSKKDTVSFDELSMIYLNNKGIDELIVQEQMVERFLKLLTTCSHNAQGVIKMRINGYPYSEIAEKLKISESSARVIDFRTKKWLKTQLGKEGLM